MRAATPAADRSSQSERLSQTLPSRCTPEQVRRARLATAKAAVDVDDCALLLDALGIGPEVQV